MSPRHTILVALATLATASTGWSETRVVGDGQAYTSIQPAMDASASGDTVLVMAGTYTEMVTFRSNVVLVSADGPGTTILTTPGPTQYRGVVYASETGPLTEIRGFTIRDQLVYLGWGAGIHVVDGHLTIRENVVTNNTVRMDLATGGAAGIMVWDGSALIEDNVVTDNTVLTTFDGWTIGGGGVTSWDSSVIVRRNLIEGNRVQYGSGSDRHFGGGGVLCVGDDRPRPDGPSGAPGVVVEDNVIRDNTAGPGGGLLVDDPLARVVRNEITDNLAERGGGVYVARCDSLAFNTIAGNTAFRDGSGVMVRIGPQYEPGNVDVSLIRNTIADNVCLAWDGGAAVAVADTGTVLIDRTIITTTKVGHGFRGHPDANITFTCNDLFGNELGSVPAGHPEVVGIDGTFAADPLFCGPDDYALREDSPCAPDGACGQVGRLGIGCAPPPRADVDVPDPARWVRVYPNPSRGAVHFGIEAGAGGVLRVWTPTGRLILETDVTPGAPLRWDEAVPAGTYFYRFTDGPRIQSGRVVRVP